MISIVIPAFNEEKTIGKCLDSFVHQTTKKKFEIIVVDNASTDNTAQIIKSYKQKLPIVYVYESLKGRGPARAAGFAKAKGEIILSTDADTIVAPNWVETMAAYFADPNVIAVTGPSRIEDASVYVNTLMTILMPQFMRIYRVLFGHYWLSGFNFAIRRRIYWQVGGFSKINAPEDIDLSFRVRKVGKITFARSSTVFMSGRRFKNGLIRGFVDYIMLGIHYYFLKDNKLQLADIRN